MDKVQQILDQSLAIRTFPTQEVFDVVDNFQLTSHDEVCKYTSNITEYHYYNLDYTVILLSFITLVLLLPKESNKPCVN